MAQYPVPSSRLVQRTLRSQVIGGMEATAGPETVPLSVSDTLGASESFVKRVNKLFADALSLVEARMLQINKRVAETVSLAENLGVVRIAVKAVSDTLGASEAVVKQVNKRVADTVSLAEAFVKQSNNALAETVAFTEARALAVSKQVADTLGFTEGFNALKVLVRAYDDTLGLSETFTKRINTPLAEAVALAEARTLTTLKQAADTLGFTEGFSALKVLVRSVSDTLGFTESDTLQAQKRNAEAVALAEAIARAASKRLNEAVGLSEGLGAQTIPAGGGSTPAACRCSVSIRIGIG